MNWNVKLTALPLLAMLLCSHEAHGVPNQMTYTGYLTKGGKAVSTSMSVVFKLFPAVTGGLSPQWEETFKNVTVTDGVFTLTLGKTKVLGAHVFKGALPKYAEIVLGGQTMSPRVPLLTVPHAFSASNCTGHLTPKSVSMGGKEVINTSGAWVGPESSASEKDPVFLKSPAGSISPAHVSKWNSAVSYSTGSKGANWVPRWNGSSLEPGSINDNGNVGIGTTNPPANTKLYVNGTVGAKSYRIVDGSQSLGRDGKHVRLYGGVV